MFRLIYKQGRKMSPRANNLKQIYHHSSDIVSPTLKRITCTNAITPLVVYIPVVIAISGISLMQFSWSQFFLAFGLGLFLWTFIEYAMHRFFYHFAPKKNNKWLTIFLLLTHGMHHELPQDKTRLVSISVVSISYALGVAFVYFLLFRHFCMPILAGTLFGYIIYDLVHYDIHVSNRKNRLFQFWKRYHFAHHYVDNSKAFGVTTPLWDYVFRTTVTYLAKKEEIKPTSMP